MSNIKSHEFLPHPRPYYPWLILLISLLFQLYKSILLIIPSIIASDVAQALQQSTLNLRFLFLAAFIPLIIFQIPVGIFLDKFGVRRITSLGIFVSAIGITLFGNSTSMTTAYIGRFLIGLGTSVALVNIIKILVNWFNPKMFATLIGLAIMLAALGDLMGIYITSAIVQAVGWRTAMINYGLLGFIFSIFFFILVKDTAPGAQYDINPKVQRLKLSSTIIRMLKCKQSWVIAIFAGLIQTPFPISIGLWGIPYLKSKYLFTEEQARFAFSALLLGICISAPIMGYISTYIKKRKVFIVTGSLVVSLLSILPMILPFKLDYLNYSFIFFFQAIFIGMLPLCITVMKEQNVPKISGTSFAFIHSSYAIFAFLSELLTKFLFHSEWGHSLSFESHIPSSYLPFIIRIPLWFGLAFIFSLFIKETHAKQKLKEELPPKVSSKE
ncbi:MAG: MFS transporter [Simkaniaceae bacterium]|nr:MAG: MFS transporter [Simkaniaceae bacterium]